ncbi:MAG: hypothetical protein R3C03_03170 [Pirellulaceae bacterium]
MHIPSYLELFDASPVLHQEQISLRGFDAEKNVVQVAVNQWRRSGIPNPGRLTLNGQCIEVGSDTEAALIRIVREAPVKPLFDNDCLVTDKEIIPQAIVTAQGINETRDALLSFVASAEYRRIASNGLDPVCEPWNLHRRPVL